MAGNCIFAAPSARAVQERCLRGRKERFAKSSYGLNCTVGSNPTLSAEFEVDNHRSGCSVARLSRLVWDQEVASSNLAIPTNKKKSRQFAGLFCWSTRQARLNAGFSKKTEPALRVGTSFCLNDSQIRSAKLTLQFMSTQASLLANAGSGKALRRIAARLFCLNDSQIRSAKLTLHFHEHAGKLACKCGIGEKTEPKVF